MRVGAAEARLGPEVDPAARVGAAIKRLDVRSDVLRRHANAANRAALQAGDVDVEQRALRRLVRQDLLDYLPGQLSAASEIEGLEARVFQRTGNARAVE